MPPGRARRVLAAAAAVVAGAGAAYYAYQLWYGTACEPEADELEASRPAANGELQLAEAAGARDISLPPAHAAAPPPAPPPADPSRDAATTPDAATAKAAADLEAHYASVQSIADSVTLPQTLASLAAAARDAGLDVDDLTARLRSGGLAGQAKLDAWRSLRAAALERAVAAPWLLAVAVAATRAQVNMLGRHLFVAAQLGGGGGGGGAGERGLPAAIPKAAQERFLEFGATLASRAPVALRDIVAAACAAAFGGATDLAAPLPTATLLDSLSAAHAAVERGIATAGWPALLLPPVATADAFFAAAAGAGVGAAGDGAEAAAADSLARGLATELAAVVECQAFGAAVTAAAAAAAGVQAAALAAALGDPPPPLAKVVPRAARAGDALLTADDPLGADALAAAAAEPALDALCAAVYSSGPPL